MLLKKVFIIIVIIVCTASSTVAYAGDPGERFDSNRLVVFSIKPYSYNADIDEDIKFKLIITNNSEFKCYTDELSQIYLGYETPKVKLDLELLPSQTIEIDISTKLVSTADFYMEESNFYVDFNIRLNYILADSSDGCYPQFYSYQTNIARLLINNLKDGSKFVELSYVNNIEETHFLKDQSYYIGTENLPSHQTRYYNYTTNVNNEVQVLSLGINEINNISIFNNDYLELIEKLKIKDKSNIIYLKDYHYYTKPSRAPDVDTFKTKAIWSHNKDYYIVILNKTYPVKILIEPDIFITEEKNDENYIIKITNESPDDIHNLYLNFSYNLKEYSLDDEDTYVVPFIAHNEFYEIIVDESIIQLGEKFLLGTQFDDHAAFWKAEIYKSSISESIYFHIGQYIGYLDISPIPEPSLLPTFTKSPTLSSKPTQVTSPEISPTPLIQENNKAPKINSRIIFNIIIIIFILLIVAYVVIVLMRIRKSTKN